MDIFTGITSILGGGITGLIGSITQRVYEYKTKKLEIEMAQLQIQAQVTHDAAIVDTEDSKAFKAAITSEPKLYHTETLSNKQQWLMVILDFTRGAIRPGLTIYLCAITTAIYFQARTLMGDLIPVDSAVAMVIQIINTILYLTTTCVLFWFGTRNHSKQK